MKERSSWRLWAAALLLLLVGWCASNWDTWRTRAQIGTGFAARIACSCRYVEGRSLESCRSDLRGLEGMRMVSLSDDAGSRTVSASMPLLASRSAHAVPGVGCLMDPR